MKGEKIHVTLCGHKNPMALLVKSKGLYTPGRISRAIFADVQRLLTKQRAPMWVCTPTRKTPRVKASFFLNASGSFFGLTRRVKNYQTNEIVAFAHVSGAAKVTVKHNLGALKHKTVLLSTRVVTVRKCSHYTRWGVTLQYPVSALRVLLWL